MPNSTAGLFTLYSTVHVKIVPWVSSLIAPTPPVLNRVRVVLLAQ